MIKLEFVESNTNDWNNWIEACETATAALVQSYQNNNPQPITDLYRGQVDRFHVHPFYGKCAYCETKVATNSPDYVEHFRPKAEVRDINNTIVQVTIGGRQVPHPGYYWLAYKWQNLLPTCWKCNTWHKDAGVYIGKGNRFPVTGNYATNPGDEATETCDLINPMFEDPKNHLAIDSLGFLLAAPGSIKGQTSITFFGLNTRVPLVDGRKKEYDTVTNKMKLLYQIDDAQLLNKEVTEISKIAKGRDEYTIAARKAISDFFEKADDIKNRVAS